MDWQRHVKTKLLPGVLIAVTAFANTGCFTMLSQVGGGRSVPSAAVALDIVTSPIQAAIFLGALPIGLIYASQQKIDQMVEASWWKSAMKKDANQIDRSVAKRHLTHRETRSFIKKRLEAYEETSPDFDIVPFLFLLDDTGFSVAEFNPLPGDLARRIYERASAGEKYDQNDADTVLRLLAENSSTSPDVLLEMAKNKKMWSSLMVNLGLPEDIYDDVVKSAREDGVLGGIFYYSPYDNFIRRAENSETSPDVLIKMSALKNRNLSRALLNNTSLPKEAYFNIWNRTKVELIDVEKTSLGMRHPLDFGANPMADRGVYIESPKRVFAEYVLFDLTKNKSTPMEILSEICDMPLSSECFLNIIVHKNVTSGLLLKIGGRAEGYVLKTLAKNPNTPLEVISMFEERLQKERPYSINARDLNEAIQIIKNNQGALKGSGRE